MEDLPSSSGHLKIGKMMISRSLELGLAPMGRQSHSYQLFSGMQEPLKAIMTRWDEQFPHSFGRLYIVSGVIKRGKGPWLTDLFPAKAPWSLGIFLRQLQEWSWSQTRWSSRGVAMRGTCNWSLGIRLKGTTMSFRGGENRWGPCKTTRIHGNMAHVT